jgi:hypothetical protein
VKNWRRNTTHPWLRHGFLVVVLATVAGFGACKSGDPSAEPATTEAKSTTTTMAQVTTTTVEVGSLQDKHNIVDTLSTFWAERMKALNPPDPNRAELLALVEGKPRENVIASIAKFQDNGWTGRRDESKPRKMNFSFSEISESRAVVQQCVVDDGVTYDSGGNPINTRVTTNEFQTVLERRPTGWVITENVVQQTTEGEGCQTLAT